MSAPATPPSSECTIVVDTREQLPWTFDGHVCASMKMHVAAVRGTLDTGDYALLGHESEGRIERKTLADFVGSVSRERERFWRELERLAAFRFRAVIVEAAVFAVEKEAYRSRVSAQAVLASALAITSDFGIPVMWAGGRPTAEWMAAWLFRRLHRRAQQQGGARA